VAACTEAGIGLTAMKTQGGGQIRSDSSAESTLAAGFLARGFTDAQARLKAVWENRDIASICSQMPNMTYLMANVAAAVDKVRLSASERRLMRTLARETVSDYCAGCTDLCESALAESVPIGDVMRFLMYARSYGEADRARRLFSAIPAKIRRRLAAVDYTEAERSCPRQMAIGRLMKEAVRELA
jgi:hypothetical protein